MTTRCPLCNGLLVRKRIEYTLIGEKLGIFPADTCQKCNEHYYHKETASLIEEAAKSKGLWNLKAATKVNKIGNSLAIRLNKRLSEFLKLEAGEDVLIYPESKSKIVIARSK